MQMVTPGFGLALLGDDERSAYSVALHEQQPSFRHTCGAAQAPSAWCHVCTMGVEQVLSVMAHRV